MGAWGLYDDECDDIQDTMCSIEQRFAEVRHNGTYEEFMEYVSNYYQEKYDKYSLHANIVVGLSMSLIRRFGTRRNTTLPDKLPDKFPEYLRKESYKALETMVNEPEKYIGNYFNIEGRTEAIKNMIKLFSNKPINYEEENKELKERIKQLEEENKDLGKENEKLRLEIEFRPDGEGAKKAEAHFKSLCNN